MTDALRMRVPIFDYVFSMWISNKGGYLRRYHFAINEVGYVFVYCKGLCKCGWVICGVLLWHINWASGWVTFRVPVEALNWN